MILSKSFLGFLVAILFGMAVVTALGVRQFSQRTELETVVHPTALGHENYVVVPDDVTFDQQLAVFAGKPVFAASLEIRDLEADQLEAMTSGNPEEPLVFLRPASDDGDRPAQYFLQVGPKQFLRVHQGNDHLPFTDARPL